MLNHLRFKQCSPTTSHIDIPMKAVKYDKTRTPDWHILSYLLCTLTTHIEYAECAVMWLSGLSSARGWPRAPTDLWPGQTHSQLSGTGCCRQQLISDPENGIGKRQERTGDAADQAGHLDLQGAADGEGRGETGAGLLLYYILKHAYLGVNRFSKDWQSFQRGRLSQRVCKGHCECSKDWKSWQGQTWRNII